MSIDTFNKNITTAETGTVYFGTLTNAISNDAVYAPYGNNNLKSNFVNHSTTTIYVSFTPGINGSQTYPVVKYKVHRPFTSSTSYLDVGTYTSISLNASDYFNSTVYNSGQIYLQAYGWKSSSYYVSNLPPAYTGTAIVSRFSSEDKNLLPSNFEGIRYYTATNTSINLTSQNTATGGISIAYNYGEVLQDMAKSLGVMAQNSALTLEKMTLLLDVVRREGVHTVNQYDWVKLIPIFDLLNSKGGSYSTQTFNQEEAINTLNTLSNYYNAIKSSITKEF
jgi:hypothetical protein